MHQATIPPVEIQRADIIRDLAHEAHRACQGRDTFGVPLLARLIDEARERAPEHDRMAIAAGAAPAVMECPWPVADAATLAEVEAAALQIEIECFECGATNGDTIEEVGFGPVYCGSCAGGI